MQDIGDNRRMSDIRGEADLSLDHVDGQILPNSDIRSLTLNPSYPELTVQLVSARGI